MGGGINYLVMLRDSLTLVVLLFCSILSFTFMIERWLYFRKADGDGDELLGHVHKLLESGKAEQAAGVVQKHSSAVARVIHYGLLHSARPRRDLEELLVTKQKEERLMLERRLGVLGTLGNIAPFIGLFGTVVGIIKAFRDLALSGVGGPTVVARGIAEALVATAGGLLVAIPAVIVYNYFMRRVKQISVGMEVASTRLLVLLGAK
ncbi:MAG: MotA/TolQ/ExbB proton channel family protein [Elusimicrobia bacterium]|nr:MotA/TolQ/ExbB proton channel family protein [Elusimicrobiota bacterium]MDE2237978.1 MotA/TolQ/ExbB proton channel family protein [Elusimicrobiota bacterium]MDE2426058.1 MotA/TolQ/ExbB proton channel family protein [Elusimicrobiota bacterium]